MRKVIFALAVLFNHGCATPAPPGIRAAPPVSLNLLEVQHNSAGLQGKAVRWGGTIVGSRSVGPQATELEILERPLEADGRPETGDVTAGRFLAAFGNFLDPEIYKVGRHITVFGTVSGTTPGRIGEHDYLYPQISVLQSHIWPTDDSYFRNMPIRFGVGVGFGF